MLTAESSAAGTLVTLSMERADTQMELAYGIITQAEAQERMLQAQAKLAKQTRLDALSELRRLVEMYPAEFHELAAMDRGRIRNVSQG